MTTKQAEQQYLAEHQRAYAGRAFAVWNPHNVPVSQLPVIYGFNNGGSDGWFAALSLAEDGTQLGGHACSAEGYMPADLGMLEGTAEYRHEGDYRPHYPDGYRMEFVPSGQIETHAGLQASIAKANQAGAAKEKP